MECVSVGRTLSTATLAYLRKVRSVVVNEKIVDIVEIDEYLREYCQAYSTGTLGK